MYHPLPGCQLLAAYSPDPPAATPVPLLPAPPGPSAQDRRAALRLISVALEVAAGRRPPRQLSSQHFSPQAAQLVRTLMRSGQLRGGARVGSLHVRRAANGLEAHGTVEAAGSYFAYSAQLTDGQLCDLRILA